MFKKLYICFFSSLRLTAVVCLSASNVKTTSCRDYRQDDYLPTTSSQQFYYSHQQMAVGQPYLPHQEVR
jgi:hypothetical protein